MTVKWIVGGVDPGLYGGVVFLEPCTEKLRPSVLFPGTRIVVTSLLPYVMPKKAKKFDVAAFVLDMGTVRYQLLDAGFLIIKVFFEKTTSHRITRRNEVGKFERFASTGGHSFGMTCGAQLAGIHLITAKRVVQVATDEWRKTVGLAKLPGEDWKGSESKVALQLWPETPEIAAHEGLAAAALIALSGLEGWNK